MSQQTVGGRGEGEGGGNPDSLQAPPSSTWSGPEQKERTSGERSSRRKRVDSAEPSIHGQASDSNSQSREFLIKSPTPDTAAHSLPEFPALSPWHGVTGSNRE
ncbi:hypothetical protein KM043_004557 [Ampulex compressa]|nr:hypothetical protein KM043_004557 [Ampulex compressa]